MHAAPESCLVETVQSQQLSSPSVEYRPSCSSFWRQGTVNYVIVAATEELHHMLIIQGIVGRPPGATGPHQAQHPQNSEMMRRRRLTDIEELRNVVDA